VAGVALFHGIDANVVHRRLREAAQAPRALPSPVFAPITVDVPIPPEAPAAVSCEAAIPTEVERGESRIMVRWALPGAAECAARLSEWLA